MLVVRASIWIYSSGIAVVQHLRSAIYLLLSWDSSTAERQAIKRKAYGQICGCAV